ncbi:Putative protein [Zobellia galactanivorans]|uniref:Uncharacterized protein n=1 Tax=Zobellia galactanivorans (strain DSM 12802 / CCUG 47099 / CIP 106680 / NCIMB 13871 / Dsij) TaxID=63186 RepID=G0LA66_ZOBGA|nr:Putative protein [Zobellia galactanivorans]
MGTDISDSLEGTYLLFGMAITGVAVLGSLVFS